MTVEALAAVMCLASGVFGRPPLAETRCLERALMISSSAARHGVDPLLMVALDVHECELREDVDAPFRKRRRGKIVEGRDACPMGVRVVGRDAEYDAAALYELAASRMAVWKKWCSRGHPGKHYRGQLPAGHHYVAHYNQGNPAYSAQVLAIRDVLADRATRAGRGAALTTRTTVIVRRYARAADGRSRS
jgi:hypothetical protein